MKAKRRRHDPEFKARAALEALKGIKTIQQIAKDFDVHPAQVSERNPGCPLVPTT
jgi:transposase